VCLPGKLENLTLKRSRKAGIRAPENKPANQAKNKTANEGEIRYAACLGHLHFQAGKAIKKL
jgi:hypothetical protein